MCLSQGVPVAVASLVYLVVIHKLEYFLNARIIGSHINARAWELLIAMLVMEAAFRNHRPDRRADLLCLLQGRVARESAGLTDQPRGAVHPNARHGRNRMRLHEPGAGAGAAGFGIGGTFGSSSANAGCSRTRRAIASRALSPRPHAPRGFPRVMDDLAVGFHRKAPWSPHTPASHPCRVRSHDKALPGREPTPNARVVRELRRCLVGNSHPPNANRKTRARAARPNAGLIRVWRRSTGAARTVNAPSCAPAAPGNARPAPRSKPRRFRSCAGLRA